jgi:hypothetical protein
MSVLDTTLHVDTAIVNAVLKKGPRGSFHLWVKDDYDLVVIMFQKTHSLAGFGLTPNVIVQTSAKVVMASRFLGLVGSLPLEEQKLWLPNQLVHDPDTEFLIVPTLDNLYKDHVGNQVLPQPGDSRPVMSPSQNTLSKEMMKKWETWQINIRKSNNQRILQ